MTTDPHEPVTPVLIKDSDDFAWPEQHPVFYLLSRDGLFLCRNHPFFRSCVWVGHGPGELASQEPTLVPRYPKIPQDLLEQVVGFFSLVTERHGSEAAAFFAWDWTEQQVHVVVPEQEATVSRGWYGQVNPVGVTYQVPTDLPADWTVFADIHSHCHHAAYASSTDREDEHQFPGIHMVVGRIDREPPDFHVEIVSDGHRFASSLGAVSGGFRCRNEDVPAEWLEKLKVSDWTWKPPQSDWSSDQGWSRQQWSPR